MKGLKNKRKKNILQGSLGFRLQAGISSKVFFLQSIKKSSTLIMTMFIFPTAFKLQNVTVNKHGCNYSVPPHPHNLNLIRSHKEQKQLKILSLSKHVKARLHVCSYHFTF